MAMIPSATRFSPSTVPNIVPSTVLRSARTEPQCQSPENDPDDEKPLRNMGSVPLKKLLSLSNQYFLTIAALSKENPVSDSGYEGDNPLLSWISMPSRVGSSSCFSGCVNAHPAPVPIQSVLIYTGHANKPQYAPYGGSITRVQEMFKELNKTRLSKRLNEWKIIPLQGKEFMEALTLFDPLSTLLVIPAGESTNLDNSFTSGEKNEIQNFLHNGGRGYFTCGSGNWIFAKRRWSAPCANYPEASPSNPVEKASEIPLIEGEAVGPLCPLPGGMMHGAGFFSIAITINDGNKKCVVFLGGGGSYIFKEHVRASDLKSAILSHLHKPSEPLSKRVKKGVNSYTKRRSFFDILDYPSSVMSKETLASSAFPRKAESLTDVSGAFERTNNDSLVSENGTFRKVESLTELSRLEKNCISSPVKVPAAKQIRVLVRYDFEELKQLGVRLGKKPSEMRKLENAAVLARIGKGAVLAATFHPYHNPNETDVERYERQFPNSGTNWREMMNRLSPLAARVSLFFNMMKALDNFEFNEN